MKHSILLLTFFGALSLASADEARKVVVGRDVVSGTSCTKAELPSWRYEPKDHSARLSVGNFTMRLPSGWTAQPERPELMVVTAPESQRGVRPTFEIMVNPNCKRYGGTAVAGRVAARGLLELLPQADTEKQVTDGKWSVGLGGEVGRSLILFDVTLKTAQGERVVDLYFTDIGEAKTFTIHTAAVCPKADQQKKKCKDIYFEMLKTAT